MKILGAELFNADGRTDAWTDMMKLIVAFRNFANVPKKQKNSYRQNARRKADDIFI
jgi:hypothetical protein